MAYPNLTNEVAIEMMAVVEYPDDSRRPGLIWAKETTPRTRQLWEDRADALIANLRYRGVMIEEK
jgi:hypothetical protein